MKILMVGYHCPSSIRIMDGDTFENVMAKVQAAEHMLLPWIVSDLSTGTLPLPD